MRIKAVSKRIRTSVGTTAALAGYILLNGCAQPSLPYRNPKLGFEKRVDDLLPRMTGAEKSELLQGRAIARLGIPALDAPFRGMNPVVASWDPDLAAFEGRSAAQLSKRVEGPDPAVYGDPWLASRMTVAWVSAVQAEGSIATVPGFPTGSNERALNETGYPAFRGAVEEAGLWSVDARSGNPAPILESWGFKGFVVNGDSVRRRLVAIFATGLFDRKTGPGVVAQSIARVPGENTVLLKNEGGLLPLAAGKPLDPKKISIVRAGEDLRQIRTPAVILVFPGGSAEDVVYGRVNPSGRLPYAMEPAYPLGHGLSYTTFTYGDLKIFPTTPRYGQLIQVVIPLRNSGPRRGAEVVQLYIHQMKSSVERPAKQLAAFERVELEPGETRNVTFELDRRATSFYDPLIRDWATEPGVFEVMVGASSRDIRARGSFELFR